MLLEQRGCAGATAARCHKICNVLLQQGVQLIQLVAHTPAQAAVLFLLCRYPPCIMSDHTLLSYRAVYAAEHLARRQDSFGRLGIG